MRTTVLNCPIDLCTLDDAINLAQKAISEKKNFQIITLNPEMVMSAQKDKNFFEIINNSNLNIVDGIGIKLALKLKGIKADNVRGVDFARGLIKLADKNRYNVAFWGAKEEIVQAAKENFLKVYPSLNFTFVKNGYFDFDNLDKRYEIYEEIKRSNPQILLVGMGSPRQEIIINELKKVLPYCIMVGVGGSFDVFSGYTKEAPSIMRKLGLEWLYRTIKEPKRLKRIFPVLPLFLLKCIIKIK